MQAEAHLRNVENVQIHGHHHFVENFGGHSKSRILIESCIGIGQDPERPQYLGGNLRSINTWNEKEAAKELRGKDNNRFTVLKIK